MKGMIFAKINEGQVTEIRCPEEGCDQNLTRYQIEGVLDDEMSEKYKRFQVGMEVQEDPNRKWCPHPNCDQYVD